MRLDDPFAAGTGVARPAIRPMVDRFGRHVSYLRLSVTDRCNLRCVYCMSDDMAFLPKQDLLSLEELDRLSSAFVARGVRRLRLTGGEPLVRRGLMHLVARLSRHLSSGALDELTLTTNGALLATFAGALAANGIRRVNVSLDSRDPTTFKAITRCGDLDAVLAGIAAARTAGLKVKINTVALNGINDGEIESLVRWAHGEGMDITLIEVMPLGDASAGRLDRFMPLSAVRTRLAERFTLAETDHRTGGPARYVSVPETGGRLGFITPLTHNFCESCNRVRVSCSGELYSCLGHDGAADLRTPLRAHADNEALHRAIDTAIARKPQGHDFVIARRRSEPALARHMSVTGG